MQLPPVIPRTDRWGSMGDFLFYFLSGMLGEELMRKLATRPYGFLVLWLIGFVLLNILILIFLFVLGVISFVKVGIPENQTLASTIISFTYDLFYFFFVMIQPWGLLFSLGVGLLLAVGYRAHYKETMSQFRKDNDE